MRRALLLSAMFGVFAAGLGCKHVGGRCDCTNHPADAHPLPPSNPYPVIGGAAAAPAAPEKMPAPMGR
jgi:hypothetical protein